MRLPARAALVLMLLPASALAQTEDQFVISEGLTLRLTAPTDPPLDCLPDASNCKLLNDAGCQGGDSRAIEVEADQPTSFTAGTRLIVWIEGDEDCTVDTNNLGTDEKIIDEIDDPFGSGTIFRFPDNLDVTFDLTGDDLLHGGPDFGTAV